MRDDIPKTPEELADQLLMEVMMLSMAEAEHAASDAGVDLEQHGLLDALQSGISLGSGFTVLLLQDWGLLPTHKDQDDD